MSEQLLLTPEAQAGNTPYDQDAEAAAMNQNQTTPENPGVYDWATEENQPAEVAALAAADQFEAEFRETAKVDKASKPAQGFAAPKAEDMLARGSMHKDGKVSFRRDNGEFMSKDEVAKIGAEAFANKPAANTEAPAKKWAEMTDEEQLAKAHADGYKDAYADKDRDTLVLGKHESETSPANLLTLTNELAQAERDGNDAKVVEVRNAIVATLEAEGLTPQEQDTFIRGIVKTKDEINADHAVEAAKANPANLLTLTNELAQAEREGNSAKVIEIQKAIEANLKAEGLTPEEQETFIRGVVKTKQAINAEFAGTAAPEAADTRTEEEKQADRLAKLRAASGVPVVDAADADEFDLDATPERLAKLRAVSGSVPGEVLPLAEERAPRSMRERVSGLYGKLTSATSVYGIGAIGNALSKGYEKLLYKNVETGEKRNKRVVAALGIGVVAAGALVYAYANRKGYDGPNLAGADSNAAGRPNTNGVGELPMMGGGTAPEAVVPVGGTGVRVPESALADVAASVPGAEVIDAPVSTFSINEAWQPGSPTAWSWAESQGIPQNNIPAFLGEVMGPDWSEEARSMQVGDTLSATAEQIARFKA